MEWGGRRKIPPWPYRTARREPKSRTPGGRAAWPRPSCSRLRVKGPWKRIRKRGKTIGTPPLSPQPSAGKFLNGGWLEGSAAASAFIYRTLARGITNHLGANLKAAYPLRHIALFPGVKATLCEGRAGVRLTACPPLSPDELLPGLVALSPQEGAQDYGSLENAVEEEPLYLFLLHPRSFNSLGTRIVSFSPVFLV